MFEIDRVQLDKLFDPKLAWDSLPFLLEGVPMTISLALIGMAIGLILGFFISLARSSSNFILRWPSRIYISFMRSTPIIVFLFLIYYGLPIMGVKLTAFVAASIAFGLNSAGYIAEIYRAALSSVDKGQWEAAKALNIPYWKAMRLIILPQAIRIAIPPLANVFLSVMLGTSLAAIITVPELFQKSQIVAGRTFDAMTMYIMVAFVYWPIGIAISYLQDRLEARYGKYVDIKANRAIN
ncbi:amino acid ABC transporter permease [Ornithinibacillus sp. BX22]|uniref:Amino acid ABC transporter permease n=2 Tax=Ornithinibacillus TaxID=484508 RepID=A0A923L451_9BACI|nr:MULTISPECIES: amino acid ABC transporter permease [Ornithinibacillus]MBC5636153.1 amino acid ABC transporter permease [Ornithinibacillus hominis]MBS3680993.1 amino acid ABC transporter permease [Ornithinibacillus massiliensis]